MKTFLKVTLLMVDGPIARGYLYALSQKNLYPEKIIHLRVGTSERGLLPRRLSRWLQAKAETAAVTHWPRQLVLRYPRYIEAVEKWLPVPNPKAWVESMLGPFPYESYTETYQTCFVKSWKDPELKSLLEQQENKLFLFAGGKAIVPRPLLEIPGLKMIHVHPGRLPEVRGADGVLWSTLVNGYPSASAFFLSPKLDQGNIIGVKDFPPLALSIDTEIPDEMLARGLYAFVDPAIRALTLLEAVDLRKPIENIPSFCQSPDEGTTFPFMHPSLKAKAIEKIYAD